MNSRLTDLNEQRKGSAPTFEVRIVGGYPKMLKEPGSKAGSNLDHFSEAGISEKVNKRAPTAYSSVNGSFCLEKKQFSIRSLS